MTDLSFAIKCVNEASAALNAVKGDLDSVGKAAGSASGDLGNASKGIDSAGDAAGRSHGPLGKLAGALGDVAKIAGGIVIAQGLLALPGLVTGAIGSASDLNESMSKMQTVFGDSAGSIEKFASTSAQSLGATKQATLEAAGTFGNLFTAIGLSKPAAADLSKGIISLGTDLASFNNIGVSEALEKLRAGLVGEAEPLRSLGVNMNEAMVTAKGLAMHLPTVNGQLTEGAKVQARYALIMAQTATAQGDFARTSDGLANQTKILQAALGDLQAEIGTALLPVAVLVVGKFLEWLPLIRDVGGAIAEMAIDKLSTLAGLAWDGLSAAWEKFGPAAVSVAGLAWDGMISLGGLAWDAFGTAWSVAAPLMVSAAGLAWDGLTALAGIAWDQFKEAWAVAGPAIATAASVTWDGLVALGQVSWAQMQSAWAVIGPNIASAAASVQSFVSSLSGTEKVIVALGLMSPAFAAVALAAKGLNMVGVDLGTIRGSLDAIVSAIGPLVALWKPLIEGDFKAAVQAAKDVGSALGPLAGAFKDLATQLEPLEPLIKPAVAALAVLVALPFAPLALAITAVLLALKPTIEFIGNVAKAQIEAFTTSIDLLNKGIDAFKEAVGPKITEVLQHLMNLITDIKNAFAPAGTWLVEAGAAIVQGIIDGVGRAAPALMSKMKSLAKDALDSAKDFLGIKSPSTEFADQVGVPIAQGVAEGFGIEWPNTIGNIQNTMGISLDQLNRDLAAWESDFLATAARNARIELGGAFNVGQMFGSSPTEGHYNPALFGGFGGGIPYLQGGGSVAAPLPAYSGPTNNAGTTGRWGGFNNGMTIQINAPVFGVDDLLKTLDTAARRAGGSGIITP